MEHELWLKAAREYARIKQLQFEAAAAITGQPTRPPVDLVAKAAAAQELQQFLLSDRGRAASELLKASGQHIVIVEDEPGGGYTTVYYLDATGLHQSIEAAGLWVAYSQSVPKPRISPATCEQVVSEAVFEGILPEAILPAIIRALDAIAKKVVGED